MTPSLRESFEAWLRKDICWNERIEPQLDLHGQERADGVWQYDVPWVQAAYRPWCLGFQAGASSMAEQAAKVLDDLWTEAIEKNEDVSVKDALAKIRSLKP